MIFVIVVTSCYSCVIAVTSCYIANLENGLEISLFKLTEPRFNPDEWYEHKDFHFGSIVEEDNQHRANHSFEQDGQ